MQYASNAAAIAMANDLAAELARGWNTWDTRSVLRHVLLPEGLAITLGFAANDKLVWLKDDVFFGQYRVTRSAGTQLTSLDKPLPHSDVIEIKPGPRTYDGTYTQLEVNLRGARFRVETGADDGGWYAMVAPLQDERWPRVLTVQAGFLWSRAGTCARAGASQMRCAAPARTVDVVVDGEVVEDPNLPVASPYVAVKLDRPVAVSAGRARSGDEIRGLLDRGRTAVERSRDAYGELRDAHEAMQTCLAWNVLYEPRFARVLCTVARDWNVIRGGYAVFCWDSFFMAWMIHLDHPKLAQATFIEAFREMIDGKFVANVVQGSGRQSRDRSQPPMASAALLAMHRRQACEPVLRSAFPALLAWSRWWHAERRNRAGSISLGSNPFAPRIGDAAEFVQPNCAAGAAIESGLDNAAIYDGVGFDVSTHLMDAEDVGLTSLYVADCEALSQIAGVLGETGAERELNDRRTQYAAALESLWNDEAGTFLNRTVSDRKWAGRQCLTSYYPLYCGAATPEQAERMVGENLASDKRYAGEWILPVSPRDDAAFGEQLYLRGRVWPPTNFLVYLGLARNGETALSRRLVERSVALIVGNWKRDGVVAENYSAVDGRGGRERHTHPLHGWGGLFALIGLIDAGYAEAPFDAKVQSLAAAAGKA